MNASLALVHSTDGMRRCGQEDDARSPTIDHHLDIAALTAGGGVDRQRTPGSAKRKLPSACATVLPMRAMRGSSARTGGSGQARPQASISATASALRLMTYFISFFTSGSMASAQMA